MVYNKLVRPACGAVLGIALCFSSTAATAATVPAASTAPMSISPFVALSAFGTLQSQSAVCMTAVGAAAGAAAGQAAPGCVLPVLDPAAPVAVDTAPVALAPVAESGSGFVGPLIAGLVALAGIAAVTLFDGDDDGSLPISPD